MFDYGKMKSRLHRWLGRAELATKVPLFDCSSCGQCIVRPLGYTCPMKCPKQMRNGPCGGAVAGRCEVFPDEKCVWDKAWHRDSRLGWTEKLEEIQPPIDWRLWGTSSWVNLVTGVVGTNGHVNDDKDEMPKPAGLGR